MKTVVYLYARVFFDISLHLFGRMMAKYCLWLYFFLSFEEELLYVSEQLQSDLFPWVWRVKLSLSLSLCHASIDHCWAREEQMIVLQDIRSGDKREMADVSLSFNDKT